MSPQEIASFKKKTGLVFVIESGHRGYRKLGLDTAPAMVFTGATTEKSFTVQGVKEFYYVDELLKIILGK
jgi:hypothetical protein